jgi:hypothetical protein
VKEMSEQKQTWKLELAIGIGLISIIMIVSFAYYAHQVHCESWYNSLESRAGDPLQFLDYNSYSKEIADFKAQCN